MGNQQSDIHTTLPTAKPNIERLKPEKYFTVVVTETPGGRRREWTRITLAAALSLSVTLASLVITYEITERFLSDASSKSIAGGIGGILAGILSYYVAFLTYRKREDYGKAVREHEPEFFSRVDKIIETHIRKTG